MADCCSPTFVFVLIRTVHYTSCLLLLAVWAFDRLVLSATPPPFQRRWQMMEMQWTLLLLPLIAISAGAWFVQLCVNMSGLPLREAMHAETVRAVWSETSFGRLWQLRSILWLGFLSIPAVTPRMPKGVHSLSAWINVVLAGALTSSLAWAGHGQDGGRWHLLADAVHLFITGLWPMGLAPFAVLLFQLRKLTSTEGTPLIDTLTRRFSTMSLCSVALLTVSGFINGLFIVGRWGDLIATMYGRVLLLKVFLFLIMLSIGAVNLLRLKPKLTAGSADVSQRMLQRNVNVELLTALIVIVVTSVLGLLSPGR